MSHLPKMWLTRPPVPCRILTVLCPWLRGPRFNRDSVRHTFDLMSLDSNCCRDRDGNSLSHYTPWPTPNSSGTNVFAQPIPRGYNIYVFPPFVLVGPLLRYFLDQRQRFAFTIIVPRLYPYRYWWAILQAVSVDSLLLGRKGDSSVLQFPSRSSPDFTARPLPWDLWAFRCVCPE